MLNLIESLISRDDQNDRDSFVYAFRRPYWRKKRVYVRATTLEGAWGALEESLSLDNTDGWELVTIGDQRL